MFKIEYSQKVKRQEILREKLIKFPKYGQIKLV